MATTATKRWQLTLLRKERNSERGFSLLELLIALTVLLIGITGILTMQVIAMRATSYSRHATEAAVLAEDKLEQMRTIVITAPSLQVGNEQVNSRGITTGDNTQDIFFRDWAIDWVTTPGVGEVRVTVRWNERGTEPHAITIRTQRVAP